MLFYFYCTKLRCNMKNEILSLNSTTFVKRESLSMVMLFLLFYNSNEACATLSMWGFQFRCSCTVKPKNFTLLTLSINSLRIISFSLSGGGLLFGVRNKMCFVLCALRDNLLAISQPFIFSKSILARLYEFHNCHY